MQEIIKEMSEYVEILNDARDVEEVLNKIRIIDTSLTYNIIGNLEEIELTLKIVPCEMKLKLVRGTIETKLKGSRLIAEISNRRILDKLIEFYESRFKANLRDGEDE